MEEILIAPCGINCRVCGMYQKRSHPCLGCRLRTTKKSRLCVIKNCREERWSSPSLCLGCAKFPCPRLRALDQRYREKTAGGAQRRGKPSGHSGKGNGSIFT